MLPRHTHSRFLLPAALLVAGCAGSQKSVSPYAGKLDKKVRSVEIIGNTAISDDTIIGGLRTHGPTGLFFKVYTTYDPTAAHTDADRIETLYRQHGYFRAEVKDIRALPVDDDFVKVSFRVNEGQPATLTGVGFHWEQLVAGPSVPLPPDADIREEIVETELFTTCGLKRDATFDHTAYIEGRELLRQLLLQHGYAHADVTGVVKVDRDEKTVAVQYVLKPGPRVKYGGIEISGNGRIPDSIIRNRVAFEQGQVYDPAKIKRTRSQLYQLGLFSLVSIDMEREGNPEVAAVHVSVDAGTRHELRLGIGGAVDNSHFEVRTRAEYTHRAPRFDPKLTFRLELRPAYQWLRTDTSKSNFGGEARARVERLDLLYRLVVGSAQVSVLTFDLESYSARGPRGQLAVVRPFWDNRIQAGVSWNIENLSFPESDQARALMENPELQAQLGLSGSYRLAYYEQNLALDLRDQLLDPHSGVYFAVAAEQGTSLAGGLNDYFKASGEGRAYFSPTARLVLAARIHHARVLRGETDLPITRRYFSGGASSHRGFTQRRLTPTVTSSPDMDGNTSTAYIGGDALLESNWEVRYDAFFIKGNWLGFVFFADGGDVSRSPTRLDLSNLHWAPGIGLRYNTVVGPVRADFAYRVTRLDGPDEPEPGEPWAFHISIGEAF